MKDATTWRSGYDVNEADLADTTGEAFSALIDLLELHLGTVFVSHTLAYITVAHNGLSEVRFKTSKDAKPRCFSVLSLSLCCTSDELTNINDNNNNLLYHSYDNRVILLTSVHLRSNT